MQYEPLLPERYFHIYNRGNNGGDLFFEDKNYFFFLDLMRRHLLPVCDILAYCLLKNHFHLLIKTKKDTESRKISESFSNLFNAYAKAINKAYNRTGSLFQDRFKRIIVTEKNYLINLILYIHLNPEQHSLVEDFRTYKYSSFVGYLGQEVSLLEKQEILSLFDNLENFEAVHESKRRTGLELKTNMEDL